MPRKRLTAANVTSLPYVKGSGKATLYWHAQCAGLALSVTPSGSRAWYFRERKAKPRTFKIGGYPEMTLAAAVRKADALRAESTALDFNLATVEQVVGRYLKEHRLKVRGIPPSEDKDQRRACGWLVETFGRQRMATVDADAAKRAMATLHATPGWHDRVRQIATAVWRFAGFRQHPFTMSKASKPYTKRGLETHEIAALLREVKAYDSLHMRSLFLVAFELATRPGELARVLWDDVDLRRKTLVVRKSKTGRDLTYTLNDRVVAILMALRANRTEGHPHPFEGQRPNRPIVKWDHAWHCIRDAAGLPGVRLYDVVRHGRATQWLAAGVSLADVSALLQHRDIATTSIYLDSTASRRKAALDLPPPGED